MDPQQLKSTTISTTTTTTEDRDSCYYPGCKKNANCDCEICIASINATLDLMPPKSSTTKLPSRRNNIQLHLTPVSFDASAISTPKSSSCAESDSPALKSTARLTLKEKKIDEEAEEKKKMKQGFCLDGTSRRRILGSSLFFGLAFGVFLAVHGGLKPVLSNEIVRSIGQRSMAINGLNRRLWLLQNELKSLVGDVNVSNCSFVDSLWKINQDGMLLNSRCVIYKSALEEVSVWGWPLQTAGLLRTGFASTSFVVLSGRATVWSGGNIGYSIRQENSSWNHRKWDASVLQLDRNTWVLEYKRSLLLDDSGILHASIELIEFKISSVIKQITHIDGQFSEFRVKKHKVPT